MAIRRCPYCKAIIDESSEYCANCGTQLLFPEDESIEEEIPGEKIVDISEKEVESLKAEDGKEEKKANPRKKKKSSKTQKKDKETAEAADKDTSKEEEEVEAEPEAEEEQAELEETEEKDAEIMPEAQKEEMEEEESEEEKETTEDEMTEVVTDEKTEEEEEEPSPEVEAEEEEERPAVHGSPEKEEAPESEEPEKPEEKTPGGEEEPPSVEEGEKSEELSVKIESLKFETEELEKIPDARTKDREEMEEILKSFQDEGGKEPDVFDEDQVPPLEEEEEEILPSPPEEAGPEERPEEKEKDKEPTPPILPEDTELPEYMKTPPEEEMPVEDESPESFLEEEEKEKKEIERFLDSVKKERADKAQSFKHKVMPTPEGGWEEEEEAGTPKEDMTPQELIDLEDKEKEDIEKFVESVKEEREKDKEIPAPGEETPSISESGPVQPPDTKSEPLPPWAEKIKDEAPPQFEETEEEEKVGIFAETEPEEVLEEQEKTPELQQVIPVETEMTPPEKVTPEDEMPAPVSGVGIAEKEKEEPPRAEERAEPEKKIAVRRPPSRFVMRLKSRAFDLFSMAVLWLLALWGVSRYLGVTLYSILSESTLPVVGFYLIMLFVYYIFFRIFLGETLGDFIFYQE